MQVSSAKPSGASSKAASIIHRIGVCSLSYN
jgi:hypothetical protein